MLRLAITYYPTLLASKNRFLSDLYFVLTKRFTTEHNAVLRGRVAYYRSLKDINSSCALLRRNTHRLEKGLIMRPRRSVFAESFIRETVECYKNAVASPRLAESEKKWATDVLNEYFGVVGPNDAVDLARAVFDKVKIQTVNRRDEESLFPDTDAGFTPYSYNQLPMSKVSVEDLENLLVRRRSVRWYKNESVPVELVQKAANLASLAPSACNRQPYRFLFCGDKKRTVDIANCAGGTSGFSENLPAIIVVIGDLSAYALERDRHLIYIDASLAAMQMMLALETLGLQSCPINWPEVDSSENKIRQIVNLKDFERVVMLLAVGYADGEGGIPYSQKKMHSHILEVMGI